MFLIADDTYISLYFEGNKGKQAKLKRLINNITLENVEKDIYCYMVDVDTSIVVKKKNMKYKPLPVLLYIRKSKIRFQQRDSFTKKVIIENIHRYLLNEK